MPSDVTGGDGVSATVTTRGHSPEELIERLKDLRPAWERLRSLVKDPSSYQGKRFSGKGTMPHGGPLKGPRERRDDDPVGYRKHVKVGRTKRKLKVRSARPFLPRLTEDADRRVAEVTLEYVLEAPQVAKKENLP